jgi:F0F1-type ATP synthase membrane subunit b/b'
MKRSGYIFILAALFLAVAQLLYRFHFWAFAGLPEPRGYVYQGLLFLTTTLLLQNTLFGPYLAVLEERDNQTVHKKAKAEKIREESERMMNEYRRGIEAARLRATAERERLALAAEQEERDRLKAAREKAGKDLSARVEALEGESGRLRPELRGQVEGIAQDILNQVVASNLRGT